MLVFINIYMSATKEEKIKLVNIFQVKTKIKWPRRKQP